MRSVRARGARDLPAPGPLSFAVVFSTRNGTSLLSCFDVFGSPLYTLSAQFSVFRERNNTRVFFSTYLQYIFSPIFFSRGIWIFLIFHTYV